MKKLLIGVAIVCVVLLLVFILNRKDEAPDAVASVEVTQSPLVEVALPATLSASALNGEQAFNANCSACHGINGAGNDGMGPPLVHIIYEPNHHGDIAFQLAVAQGVRQHHWPFGNMEPRPEVTPEMVEDIVSYIREVQRANGIE